MFASAEVQDGVHAAAAVEDEHFALGVGSLRVEGWPGALLLAAGDLVEIGRAHV